MAKPSKPPPRPVNHPEKKIGPYAGGVGVAIWLNTVDTQNGPRQLRSITISPRRYRDPESGEWRDSGSYRMSDLPALIFALQKAQEFCYTVPIQSDNGSGDRDDDGEVPF